MDPNFNEVYRKDAAAICSTTTLESHSGNDDVTSSEPLESDILVSIKQEEMVGSYNVCVCTCARVHACVHFLSATTCGYCTLTTVAFT
jgi:hypothetical protein